MKLVALSQRVDAYPDRNEWRDAIDQKLASFLLEAGFLAVPVPNSLCTQPLKVQKNCNDLTSWLEKLNISAVVLSGGNDIGTCLERDNTEAHLLNYASKHHLPVLGICRGMQMMGIWAGAELKTVSGHVRTRHQLSGEITDTVNSYHNQCLAGCPPGYSILSTSEDGEIEAIQHLELPWQGWMWHPEREDDFSTGDIARIKKLFHD